MKAGCESRKVLHLLFVLTCFVHAVSPSENSACILDFSSYKPSGDCIGDNAKINAWDSFPTRLCCRNALTTLSQALARQAKIGDRNIFIKEDQWMQCDSSIQKQQSVSFESCGFKDLYYEKNTCTSLSLSNITEYQLFQDASNKCGHLNPWTDDSCGECSKYILQLRDSVLEKMKKDRNNEERAVCVVAVVTSIVAAKLDDPSTVDSIFWCLTSLDVLDPGYIKLKYSMLKTLLASVLATLGLMLVIVLTKYVTKNTKKTPKAVKTKEISVWSGLYRFSKAEIENAINFGNERTSLGRGSAGHVYKGVLPSGQVVAIKHIYKTNTSDSFTREVEGLSRVRHPNLVCLFGCCMDDGEQYLVYEYCSAGNLSHHLLKKDTVLTWERRVKILRDCSLALRYLHHHIDGCIVHRDIKLTNILLTNELDPKLSDFGLAKMLGMDETKVYTDVRGTIGYMDPEYMSNAKLTCASDIYSFGIVALQLLSGQKVIELDLGARDQLTRKAKDVSMGKRPLTDFQDPRLNGNLNSMDFESILQIAVLCVAKSSKGRPTVDVVFDELEKVWKNTNANVKTKRETSSSSVPESRSLDMLPV